MTYKVAFNSRYGGYSLSHKALLHYAKLKGIRLFSEKENFFPGTLWKVPPDQQDWLHADELILSSRRIARHDPVLIRVIEEMGEEANGECAKLEIIELDDDVIYRIEEYDGMENVHTDSNWSHPAFPNSGRF